MCRKGQHTDMALVYPEGSILIQPGELDLVQVTQFLEQVHDWQRFLQGDGSGKLDIHHEAWSMGALLPGAKQVH